MEQEVLRLPVRTDLKKLMDQIVRDGGAIKRAAHRFEIDETAHLQMQTLVRLVAKAEALMNSLKPQPAKEKEDYFQQVLDFDPAVDAQQDTTMVDDAKMVDLDPVPLSTNGNEL